MNKKVLFSIFFALLVTFTLFACSDDSDDGDNTAPTVVSITPEDASFINGSQTIVIVFNEKMKTTSAVLTGDMGDESDGGVWSTTTVEDDTLTISPGTAWTSNATAELAVDCKDAAGNGVDTVELTYDVDGTVPSADPDPADGSTFNNPGYGDQPIIVTFSESINTSTLDLSGTILLCILSVGTYTVSWSDTAVADDTLTIQPDDAWDTPQEDKTVIIECDDLAGNHFSATYTYDINY